MKENKCLLFSKKSGNIQGILQYSVVSCAVIVQLFTASLLLHVQDRLMESVVVDSGPCSKHIYMEKDKWHGNQL